MIRYISSFSVKTLHSMVNCGLLRMLTLVADPREVTVEATESSVETLRAVCPPGSGIPFRSLRVNAAPGRLALLARYLQSAACNIRALMRSRRGDTLIYNFNNLFSLAAVNFLGRRMLKGRKIIIFCHGEMEYLANADKHKKAYKRLMTRLTKSFFTGASGRHLAPGMRFVVLGDSILDELQAFLPAHMLARFSSIDHPVSAVDTMAAAMSPKDNVLRIGTVGILNRYKGSDAYIRLLERIGRRKDLEFSIVGQIQQDLGAFRNLPVTLPSDPAEALDDDEFRAMVARLDYVLLLYPSDTYRLIASGAVLDCIRFGRPLIAITNPYFRYLFSRFGDLGILADDERQLADIITAVAEGRMHVPDPDPAIARARAALSPEALAPGLAPLLND